MDVRLLAQPVSRSCVVLNAGATAQKKNVECRHLHVRQHQTIGNLMIFQATPVHLESFQH